MTVERLFLAMRYGGHRPSHIAYMAWAQDHDSELYPSFGDEFDEASGQWRLVQYVEDKNPPRTIERGYPLVVL